MEMFEQHRLVDQGARQRFGQMFDPLLGILLARGLGQPDRQLGGDVVGKAAHPRDDRVREHGAILAPDDMAQHNAARAQHPISALQFGAHGGSDSAGLFQFAHGLGLSPCG